MNKPISSLWERIRQKASVRFGNGSVPEQYRRMFRRKNNSVNAARCVSVVVLALFLVLVQALGVMGGLLQVQEPVKSTSLIASYVFMFLLVLILSVYLMIKRRIIRGTRIMAVLNHLTVGLCITFVVFIALLAYPMPESLMVYIIGLFAYAMFFYSSAWQSVGFYLLSHAVFVTLLIIFWADRYNLTASIFFSTACVIMAWMGSRILYRVRAGAFMSDVTQAELQHMSLTDPLLGISNRRKFDIAIQFSWNYCRREQKPISLVMIDIDYFKKFNDRFGHSEGDECLRRVSRTIGSMIHRESDELARVGGEELAFMLPLTPLEDAVDIMEKARAAIVGLGIPNPDSPHGVITVSAGVACTVPGVSRRVTSWQELYEAADNALYHAKKTGRNRICID
ncbi:MAG: GGDEF domain-containing protein [Bacillota bacterium]